MFSSQASLKPFPFDTLGYKFSKWRSYLSLPSAQNSLWTDNISPSPGSEDSWGHRLRQGVKIFRRRALGLLKVHVSPPWKERALSEPWHSPWKWCSGNKPGRGGGHILPVFSLRVKNPSLSPFFLLLYLVNIYLACAWHSLCSSEKTWSRSPCKTLYSSCPPSLSQVPVTCLSPESYALCRCCSPHLCAFLKIIFLNNFRLKEKL